MVKSLISHYAMQKVELNTTARQSPEVCGFGGELAVYEKNYRLEKDGLQDESQSVTLLIH